MARGSLDGACIFLVRNAPNLTLYPLVPLNDSTPVSGDDPAATRSSLIRRLHDWEDHAGWQDFFDTYWKLIYAVAIKAGLSDAEARDVVQETVVSVARSLQAGQYDRARGSFKAWLHAVTRNRITDHFRRRQRSVPLAEPKADSTTGTRPIARIPDPASLELDAVWEEEWQKNLLDAATQRVRAKVPPDQFQIFDLYALKGLPVGEVARLTRSSRARVYVVKHRVSGMIRGEVGRLERALAETGVPRGTAPE
jgi:RNA polymerase sigma factor (sigma-70 family)